MNKTKDSKISAGVILDTNRDIEVLNRFVRIHLDDTEVIEGDQKDPLKALKPDTQAPAKAHSAFRGREERAQKYDPHQEKQDEQEPGGEKQDVSGDDKQIKSMAGQREKFKSRIGQKQIYQELKKRKKKRKRPKPEEVYTDKDRAAAVNMGTRDIKQSLKIKKRQDRARAMQIPDEAEPSTFLALGNAEMRKGDGDVALIFFMKALELDPSEKNCLVARSRCYLLLGQPENGLKDAEAALEIDKHFIKGIYQKAEALYFLGDFEHSLMYYHRGLRIRPDHEGFQLGVRKAQKAIENAIGRAFPRIKKRSVNSSRSKTQNSTTTPTSKMDSSKGNTASGSKRFENSCKQQMERKRPMTRPKTACGTSGILLRELKTDKEYLNSLLSNPDLKCKNKEDNSEIAGYIQEAVEFLKTRQEFWRQQMPKACKY